MNSIQISIEADEELQEILISKLSEFNAEGFEQTDKNLLAYFSEANFDSYEVNEILKDHSFTIQTIEEQNWNKVWESNFEPVIIEDFCAVRAEFHPHFSNVAHEIIITPKMSFGTGHHATTYMMISQMKEIDFRNKLVFDFGTGTGILAILAEKLGAEKIEAIDVDSWSIINAEENAEKNQCKRISLKLSTTIPEEKFDIILANINRNVILQYLSQLKSCMSKKAYLLLSGLLVNDEKDIRQACEQEKLLFVSHNERNGWVSLLFMNKE
jgi:ribosomal protein L11 methyltransferase